MTNMTFAGLWEATQAAVRRDFAAFLTLTAAFIFLPALLVRFTMPTMTDFSTLGARPVSHAGLWPLLLLALVAQCIGLFSIAAVTADPDQGGDRTFAMIMRSALPAVLRFVGAIALMYVALLVVTVVVTIIVIIIAVAMGAGRGASTPPSVATILGWTLAGTLLTLPVVVWLQARLSPLVGVYLREHGGVIAGIRRAWGLSRGHGGPIAGMILTYMVLGIVISVAVLALGQVTRQIPTANFIVPILLAVPGMFVNVYLGALLGVIYRQLDDQSSGMRGAVSGG